MVGVSYLIEGVIYVFLESYQYYPHLLQYDPYYDSNMGAIASNFLALPISAVFLAVFRKNWIWIIFFIVIFAGIEWLFLKLHIYKHNWWKIEFTACGLLVYYPMAKYFHQKILNPLSGIWHYILLNLIIGGILGTLHIVPIMLFNNRYYRPGWFEMVSHDTTAFGVLYYICLSLLIVILTMVNSKRNWFNYVIVFLTVYLATFILSEIGVLHSLVWWDRLYYYLMSIFTMLIAIKFSKYLQMGQHANC